MTKSEAKKRIEKLKREISHHRYLYHVLDKTEISDAAQDSLKHELAELEHQFPGLVTPDSPTQRVGGKPLSKFRKVKFGKPMLSLNDAFVDEEVYDWEERNKKLLKSSKNLSYYGEIKMDGLAITLIYRNGILIRAATRGDGKVGEDVTQNIKTIEAIPLKLAIEKLPKGVREKAKGEIEVRGEVYMGKKEFSELNKEQKKMGEPLYANPRNVAAGSVRQLDSKITALRPLSFFAYDLVSDLGQRTHEESHKYAKLLGFKVNEHNKFCKDIREAIKYHDHIGKMRERFPYWTDGIVLNINDIEIFRKLGVVGKAPRGAIAFKYPAKQATTVVEDIEVQIGRTGALTPVAHLKPVQVAGTTVARATLHNEDEIGRLGVKIGDTVIIQKAGDIIPDVVKVLTRMRSGREKPFAFPKTCPICGSKVERKEGEVAHYCTNKKCFAQNKERLSHFISKAAFDIEGLGPQIIDQLIEQDLISRPSDIFELKESDLVPLEGFAEKAAINIIDSIKNSKKITLARFIYALGIRHVGEETAIDLASNFGSINKIKDASIKELENVYEIGEVVARSVCDFFQDKDNIELMDELISLGVEIENPKKKSAGKVTGKSFILTGTLDDLSRDEAKKMIRDAGGRVASSVSKSTDYVVAGTDPGSKHDRAKQLGIKIISEKELWKILE